MGQRGHAGQSGFCHIRITKNGKKLLLGQQLQLTIKEVVTNNRQYGFF